MATSPALSVRPLQYRPLAGTQNEIRLLSFEESTSYNALLRLKLSYVSLNDWKPEYLSFRDHNEPILSTSELCKAWTERSVITPRTPKHDIYNNLARFNWGDYTCLSYAWGDESGKHATILLDGIATSVSKRLEAALRDVKSSYECRLGMKLWVDALCINQADAIDRGFHILRVKDIFRLTFAVTVWAKDDEDLNSTGGLSANQLGERLLLCEKVLIRHGRQVLEELLGVRRRNWGMAEDEDRRVRKSVQHADELVFDDGYYADSDDEDEFSCAGLHLRDVVCVELMYMFWRKYWSRLWIIQELAAGCMTSNSKVHWVEGIKIRLLTLTTIADVLLTNFEALQPSNPEIWKMCKPGLDLLAFCTSWDRAETASGGTGQLLDDASVRELNLLAARANCLLPHDRVYALLGLFPSSVLNNVTVDYSMDAEEVMAEFTSAVPQWTVTPVGEEQA